MFDFVGSRWMPAVPDPWAAQQESFGEVRVAGGKLHHSLLAGIQPMHGTMLCVYNESMKKQVIAEGFGQGHALAVGSFTTTPMAQIVAGWRGPDSKGQTGIKIYIPKNERYQEWTSEWVDENGMACEDLQLADLNGDGKMDIVASGRSSHNLKIYWNTTNR